MKSPVHSTMFFILIFLFFCCEEPQEPLETVIKTKSQTSSNLSGETKTNLFPCNFDLEKLPPETNLKLTCIYNLRGKKITLPKNTTLTYSEGAKIYNGTISGENLILDSKLLNKELSIQGKAQLKNSTLHIIPSNWGIIQGKTTTQIALENRKNINLAIKTGHQLNASTIELDQIDAYFSVSGNILSQTKNAKTSIRIPSNTHFKMSDNTYLRIQPSNGFTDYLLHASLGYNITISGGHLIGDRYEHDYSPINDILGIPRNTHEYGAAIMIAGVQNAVVDNVDITSSTGDGILCQSSAIRHPDGTPQKNAIINKNIVIKNSRITQSRRNNISLTDGDGYLIENCSITNAGLDVPGNPAANGTWPKSSIDMEAYRIVKTVNGRQQLLEYEKLTNILIRGNRFTGNRIGLVFCTVSRAIAENNFFDDGIGSLNANHCIVRNNIFERSNTSNMDFSRAVSFNSFIRNGVEEAINNEISNNTITGYKIGIAIQGEGAKIYKNKVYDFQTGLNIGKRLKNVAIHNNEFKSRRAVSYGYFSLGATTENVVIHNNKVDVLNRGIYFMNINKETSSSKFHLTIKDCKFKTKRELYFQNCKNITFKNSTISSKTIKDNCENIIEQNIKKNNTL